MYRSHHTTPDWVAFLDAHHPSPILPAEAAAVCYGRRCRRLNTCSILPPLDRLELESAAFPCSPGRRRVLAAVVIGA